MLCLDIDHKGSRDWCFVWNAIDSGDRDLCLEVNHRDRIKFCEAGVDMNQSRCYDILQPDVQGFCISNIAWHSRNASLCDLISGPGRSDRCYILMAHRMQNPSLCEYINDRDYAEICHAFVDADTEKCKAVSRSPWADECYMGVAYLTLQPKDAINSWGWFMLGALV